MQNNALTLDPSILQISDTTPIKVTFLNAQGEGHFAGFYTFENTYFSEIRTLFGQADSKALIPNVSSVFLGNRLQGKTPVFFIIKNGFDLNKSESWFPDAIAGRNGFWQFIAPCEQTQARLDLQNGQLFWLDCDNQIIAPAKPAHIGTSQPILIWQTNNGKVGVAKGEIIHSYGYGVYNDLNPNAYRYSTITLEDNQPSVVLNFFQKSDDSVLFSVRLNIGSKNWQALTLNRVIHTILPMPETSEPFQSVEIEIPEEFEDTLYIEGFENQETIPMGGVNFEIKTNGNKLNIKAEAFADVYESLLCRVKIKTDASAIAKSQVITILKTTKETFNKKGKIDILAQDTSSIISGISLPPSVLEPKEKSAKVFVLPQPETVTKQETLPSFITEMPAVKATPFRMAKPAQPKTALIIAGASKQGCAIAYALAAKGYNIIVHCHKSISQATRLVEDLRQKYQVKASYIRADFLSYEETADLISAVYKTYGLIDVLVYQAYGAFEEENQAGFDTNINLNLRAFYLLLQTYQGCLSKGQIGNAVCVFEQENPESLNVYNSVCAGLKNLVTNSDKTFNDKLRMNGVLFSKTKQSLLESEIANMVSFLAENKAVSAQLFKLGASPESDKKR